MLPIVKKDVFCHIAPVGFFLYEWLSTRCGSTINWYFNIKVMRRQLNLIQLLCPKSRMIQVDGFGKGKLNIMLLRQITLVVRLLINGPRSREKANVRH